MYELTKFWAHHVVQILINSFVIQFDNLKTNPLIINFPSKIYSYTAMVSIIPKVIKNSSLLTS